MQCCINKYNVYNVYNTYNNVTCKIILQNCFDSNQSKANQLPYRLLGTNNTNSVIVTYTLLEFDYVFLLN